MKSFVEAFLITGSLSLWYSAGGGVMVYLFMSESKLYALILFTDIILITSVWFFSFVIANKIRQSKKEVK